MAPAPLRENEFQQTRRRMAVAGLAIYRAEGLKAISFRKLGDAIGMSHMAAYRYFRNKDELLALMRVICFEAFDQHLRSRIVHQDSLARFLDAGLAYVEYVLANRADYMLMFALTQPPPAQYPELFAIRRSTFDYMVELVRSCVQDGHLSGEARDITHVAWVALHGVLTLEVAQQLVYDRTFYEVLRPLLISIFKDPTRISELMQSPEFSQRLA